MVTVSNGDAINIVLSASSIPTIIGIQGPQGTQGSTTVANSVDKVAGEGLSGNRAVMIATDGKVYYADRSNITHINKVLGITQTSATLGATVSIQTYGVMTEPSWVWDMSLPIFLSTNGLLTQAAPTLGFMLIFGFPLSVTSMFIDIDKPIQIV